MLDNIRDNYYYWRYFADVVDVLGWFNIVNCVESLIKRKRRY